MRAIGADANHYHPIVDATAVARAVSFIGLKVSEGAINVDPTFAMHLSLVRAQPFELVILYHIARPGNAGDQASRLLHLVGDLRPNERLALDTERTSNVGVGFIQEFFGELPGDRRHLLYTSAGVWSAMENPAFPEAASVDLWLPRYGSQSEPQVPDPWFNIGRTWSIWQNSESGNVPGIDGPCDTNLFNGDLNALRAFAALPP